MLMQLKLMLSAYCTPILYFHISSLLNLFNFHIGVLGPPVPHFATPAVLTDENVYLKIEATLLSTRSIMRLTRAYYSLYL